MQQMLNDILKVYVYGYVKDISHKLDPVAKSWNPEIDQNMNNNKDEKITVNDQEKQKEKIDKTNNQNNTTGINENEK